MVAEVPLKFGGQLLAVRKLAAKVMQVVVGELQLLQHREVLRITGHQVVESGQGGQRRLGQRTVREGDSGELAQTVQQGQCGLRVGGGRQVVRDLGPQPG